MGFVRITVDLNDEFAEILRKRRKKYGRNQVAFINDVIRIGLDKIEAEARTSRPASANK